MHWMFCRSSRGCADNKLLKKHLVGVSPCETVEWRVMKKCLHFLIEKRFFMYPEEKQMSTHPVAVVHLVGIFDLLLLP